MRRFPAIVAVGFVAAGAGGEYWYFLFAGNPAIRPGIDGGAMVEFSLVYDSKGRPTAIDVIPIRGTPIA